MCYVLRSVMSLIVARIYDAPSAPAPAAASMRTQKGWCGRDHAYLADLRRPFKEQPAGAGRRCLVHRKDKAWSMAA